jgi:hypothetical protein
LISDKIFVDELLFKQAVKTVAHPTGQTIISKTK